VDFSKDAACRIFSNCNLAPRTSRIAEYWLSIWDGECLPARASIAPTQIKPLLSGVIIFRVVPGQSVTVRMAGTGHYAVLKFELTGQDWLAATSRKDQAARLAILSDVARGGMALGRWIFPQKFGREIRCEKLLLPLRPESGDSGIPVLGFIDWAPGIEYGADISLQKIPLPDAICHIESRHHAPGRSDGAPTHVEG
jgi:hypothetical protein